MSYASTLNGAVTADATDVYVDDIPSTVPNYVQIDDEIMAVCGLSPAFTTPVSGEAARIRIAVERPVSTRATHSDGATVTGIFGIGASSGGGGGGVSVDNGVDAPATVTTIVAPGATIEGDSATLLSTRLIGPFRVTHATPDLDEGAKLTDLAVGTIVLRLWAEITEDFGATLGVNVGPTDPGPPDDDYDLAVLYADGTSTSNPGRIGEHSPSGASPFGGWGSRIFRVLAPGGSLAAYVASPGATGIADVYAIIATAS